MSVPYKIEASEELLVAGGGGGSRASDRIPFMARPFVSERAKKTLDLVCSYSTSMVASQRHANTLTRSRSSSKKNVSPQTPYTHSRSAKACKNDSARIHR